jgi:PAS domain S-box-containing protein
MITENLPAAILRSHGYALFEYMNDGLFQPLGQPPSWWIQISHKNKSPKELARLAERFPFIESFLVEAQEFWLLKAEGCVRSGIWMEGGEDQCQMPLECSALWLDERRLLLIQAVPLDIYEQQYHLFQTARQARLSHAEELSHAHEQIDMELAGRKRVEEALKQNEAEFRMIFENAAIGIALVDDSGHLTRSNPALQTMLGYPEDELRKLTLVGITHPDESAATPSLYSEIVAGKRDQYQMNKRYVRKDGNTGWARLTVSALRQGSGRLQSCVAMVEDITQQELAEQSLRQLTGRLIRAQEEERSRIARELHDHLNQRLGLLAIELGQLHDSLSEGNHELMERFDKLCQETDEISEDVHRLSHNLHSSILENLGLVPAVRTLCTEFSQQHSIKVEFEVRKLPSGFSSEVALCLFRVVQECLSNIAKHSRARLARVGLDGDSSEVRLIVEDDGVGFDLEARQGKPGLGLVSIRERLHLVGGNISIRSSPSTGTRIEARAPLASWVNVGGPGNGRFGSAAMQSLRSHL